MKRNWRIARYDKHEYLGRPIRRRPKRGRVQSMRWTAEISEFTVNNNEKTLWFEVNFPFSFRLLFSWRLLSALFLVLVCPLLFILSPTAEINVCVFAYLQQYLSKSEVHHHVSSIFESYKKKATDHSKAFLTVYHSEMLWMPSSV